MKQLLAWTGSADSTIISDGAGLKAIVGVLSRAVALIHSKG